MGQKVNPHGLRVGIIKNWDSRWYADKKTYGDTLVEDYKIREFLKKRLYKAGVPDIEIERDPARVRVHIHCAKPGMVIGQKGAEIEKLRLETEKLTNGKPVNINIIEIKNPDMNAQLVAENIASQLEGRVSFRRAMKSCIGRTMKSGAKGIKTMVSGRLGGAEIARSESYHEGTIPLQTLRADIEYGIARANTTYGVIGVKVWLYKGEVLKGEISSRPAEEKRPRRRGNDSSRSGRSRQDRGDRSGFKREGRSERSERGERTDRTDRQPRAERHERTEKMVEKKEGGNE